MMLHQSLHLLPIGSTVVVQQEDGGPWTHGTIVGKGDHNHHNYSYTTSTHNNWQENYMQQMTHQANISNSRCLHTLPSHKTYKQTNQSTGCYPGTHQRQPTGICKQACPQQLARTFKTHMLNNNQKISHKEGGRTLSKKTVNNPW